MDSNESPPGFDRVEIQGQKRAFYLSRPQELGLAPGSLPRKLNDITQVTDFLTKENIRGVDISQFDFRKKLKKRAQAPELDPNTPKIARSSIFSDNGDGCEGTEGSTSGGNQSFNLTHLLRPSAKVDHRSELEDTAQELVLITTYWPQ